TTGLWKQTEGFHFEQVNEFSYSNPIPEIYPENSKNPEYLRLFKDGLSFEGQKLLSLSDTLWTITKDYEEGIWIKTSNDGIYQVLPKKMITIGGADFPVLANAYGLFESPDLTIWIAAFGNGIFKMNST